MELRRDSSFIHLFTSSGWSGCCCRKKKMEKNWRNVMKRDNLEFEKIWKFKISKIRENFKCVSNRIIEHDEIEMEEIMRLWNDASLKWPGSSSLKKRNQAKKKRKIDDVLNSLEKKLFKLNLIFDNVLGLIEIISNPAHYPYNSKVN